MSGQKGPRVTACVAISPSIGVIHYQLYAGGMTKELFGESHANHRRQLRNGTQRCSFSYFDNTSSHNDAEIHEMENVIDFKRLPKYSPFLTPVEMLYLLGKQPSSRKLTTPWPILFNLLMICVLGAHCCSSEEICLSKKLTILWMSSLTRSAHSGTITASHMCHSVYRVETSMLNVEVALNFWSFKIYT